MEKFKDTLKKYRYPSIYLLIFFIFTFVYPNLFLLILSFLVFTFILFLMYKDNITTTFAIGKNNSGDTETAEKILQKLIDEDTKNATSYAYYGFMLLNSNKIDDAINVLEKGLTKKPNTIIHKNICLSLASAYWLKGDYKKGISILEDLQKQYDYVNDSVLSTLGYLYFLDGNLEKAKETSHLALQDNPECSAALDNLGQIALKEGNLDKAKEYFEKALNIKDTLIDSLYNLGIVYEKQGNIEEALECFEKAKLSSCSVFNTVTHDMVLQKIEEINKNSK